LQFANITISNDWLGKNVDKAQDKDRNKVRKISITGQKDKTEQRDRR
jgi:hypothetical protein